MKTSTKILFLSTTMLSSMMVMFSTSWLSMWIGLEINLMSFIPLISQHKNKFISQSMMMYFLTQSMASMIFLSSILIFNYLNMKKDMIMETCIMAAMMMKMGMPPFHFWFPEMMNKMKWNLCFMLMTWQKLAPMHIISMTMKISPLIMLMICMATILGAIGGINQTSSRKIMAYSSMNHLGWLSICALSYKKSWMIYMMIYSMLMLMMTLIMNYHNIMFINQMNIPLKNNLEKINLVIMMLSMGGIPPFLGFIPKWITIQYLISSQEIIVLVVMIMSTLVTLSYYLRLSSSINLLSSKSQKWTLFLNSSKSMITSIFIMNMLFPMMILIMNFI